MRTSIIFLLCVLYILSGTFLLTEYPPVQDTEASYAYSGLAFKEELRLKTPGLYHLGSSQTNSLLPPLFMLVLAGDFSVFAFNLFNARLLGVVFGGMTLFVLIAFTPQILKKDSAAYKKKFQEILALLLFVNPFFFSIIRVSRPDVFAAFFAVTSFVLFLLSTGRKPHHKYRSLVLSGLFAGLGILAHQYVSFFSVAIATSLLFCEREKKIRAVLSFLTIPVVVSLMYWIYFPTSTNVIVSDAYNIRMPLSVTQFLISPLLEPFRFMNWPSALFSFLLFLPLFFSDLIFFRKNSVPKKYKQIYFLLFLIFLLFTFFEKQKHTSYFIYYYPLLMIYSSVVLTKIVYKKRFIAFLILGIYVAISLFSIGLKIANSYDGDFENYCNNVLPLIPNEGKILVDGRTSFCLKDYSRIFFFWGHTITCMPYEYSQFIEQNVTSIIGRNISEYEALSSGQVGGLDRERYRQFVTIIKEHCKEKASIYDPHHALWDSRDKTVYSCDFSKKRIADSVFEKRMTEQECLKLSFGPTPSLMNLFRH